MDRDTPDGRLITALEMAIRDVQKMRFITEILDAWKSDKHTYYVLEEIRKVVEE